MTSLSDNKIVPHPLPFVQSAGCRRGFYRWGCSSSSGGLSRSEMSLFFDRLFFFWIGFDLTSGTNLSESLWLIFFGGDFFRSEVRGFGPKEMTEK